LTTSNRITTKPSAPDPKIFSVVLSHLFGVAPRNEIPITPKNIPIFIRDNLPYSLKKIIF